VSLTRNGVEDAIFVAHLEMLSIFRKLSSSSSSLLAAQRKLASFRYRQSISISRGTELSREFGGFDFIPPIRYPLLFVFANTQEKSYVSFLRRSARSHNQPKTEHRVFTVHIWAIIVPTICTKRRRSASVMFHAKVNASPSTSLCKITVRL